MIQQKIAEAAGKLRLLGWKALALGFLTLVMLAFYLPKFNVLKLLFFMALFTGGNVLLNLYRRKVRLPFEFELITFGTVLITAGFGPAAGIVFSLLTVIITGMITTDFSIFTLVSLVAYPAIAIVSAPFGPESIVALGILVTLAKNLVIFFFYQFLFEYNLAMNLSFSLTNIMLNLILFLRLGQPLLKLIG